MPYKDSVDKVMMYISSLVKGEFNLEGYIMKEKKIIVSPLILREIKCVRHCGACCNLNGFTMDWLPDERKPDEAEKRIKLGKEIYTVYPLSKERRCNYLDLETGDCMIHEYNQFTCDFELIRFKQFVSKNSVLIGTFPYGRCWAMTQYNGTKGGLCIKSGYSEQYKKDVIRKLNRLKDWINYYEVPTYIDELISCVENMNSCSGTSVVLNEKNWELFSE